MRKFLFVFGAISVAFSLHAQTFVSTTPMNKSVLLEEFTGINCQFCPDGHVVANNLAAQYPGTFIPVNVHAGGFATPGAGQPDFRTGVGNAIDGNANPGGYPAGSINRRNFPNYVDNAGGTAMGRGDWAAAANIIRNEAAPVNVAAQGTIDLSTRVLTLTVEVYYTGNSSSVDKLNVFILQDNIAGPQTGAAQWNPGQINPDGTYNHTHMLRHAITGTWGEDLATVTQGSFISRNYTYTIPATWSNIPAELLDLEIVVFVADNQREVLNASYGTINFSTPNNYDAFVKSVTMPAEVCSAGGVVGEVKIQNLGNQNLTSLDLAYNFNNGAAQGNYTWNGNLALGAIATVNLPAQYFNLVANNTLSVTASNPNNNMDQNAANNSANTTFGQSTVTANNAWTLSITTDGYATETGWQLINDANNQIVMQRAAGYYNQNNTTVNETLPVLSGGCYTLKMTDSYGDGLCCQYGNGSYTLRDAMNATLASGNQFGASEENVVALNSPVGTNQIEASVEELVLFPNPANDNIQVRFSINEAQSMSVRIADVLGKTVYSNIADYGVGTHDLNVALGNMAAGTYTVFLQSEGKQSAKRFAIVR